MHMADAMLSTAIGGTFYVTTDGLLALAVRQMTRVSECERCMPLIGMLGAVVFAAHGMAGSDP